MDQHKFRCWFVKPATGNVFMKLYDSYRIFTIQNAVQEKTVFLNDDSYIPKFTYGAQFTEKSPEIVPETKTRELINSAVQLQVEPSETSLQRFQNANSEMYGVPTLSNMLAILSYVKAVVDNNSDIKKKQYWMHIEETLAPMNFEGDQDIFEPDHNTFLCLQGHFKQYAGWLFEKTSGDLVTLFEQGLAESKLDKKGWKLLVQDSVLSASIFRTEKEVIVGSQYPARTSMSAQRIVAHELYGHANRSGVFGLRESEGFAILLEQLLGNKFGYRRSFRYLAAALGWGVHGTPLDFRQVYEILWRCICIVSKYNESGSKDVAFNECVRVFRGGRPDVAGAVYLKDIAYFEGNIAVWNALSENEIRYDDFVAIIEGRKILT